MKSGEAGLIFHGPVKTGESSNGAFEHPRLDRERHSIVEDLGARVESLCFIACDRFSELRTIIIWMAIDLPIAVHMRVDPWSATCMQATQTS